MSSLLGDLRYAVRTLARSRGFTLVAVAALALGIGANTAIFTVVNAVLLRPLAYREPARLVHLWQRFGAEQGGGQLAISPPEFVVYREQSRSFESMGAFFPFGFNLTDTENPERVDGALVTSAVFTTLGVQPMLGRVFTPEDEREGAERVAVLSYGLWRRRFNADPRVVGKTYQSGGRPVTVAGVMPRSFKWANAELWRPLGFTAQDLANRSSHYLSVVARLRPGVTVEQAEADVKSLATQLGGTSDGVYLNTLHRELVGNVRPVLLVLWGAVGLVLLIACANVANLLLSRGASRQREVAVRTALGASRGRLVRQLLTESILLALVGAGAGLLLALWAIKLLVVAAPVSIPRLDEIRVDAAVLAVTLGVSVLTGVLFGAVPALQASRINLHETLKEGNARASGGMRQRRLRRVLVVSEIAFSLVLLVGAGLLIRSVARLGGVKSGIAQPERLLTMRTNLPPTAYPDDARRVAFYRALLERVATLPGVRGAAVTSVLPFTSQRISGSLQLFERPRQSGGYPEVNIRWVSPGYFRTMGVPLRRGRLLSDADREGTARVVVINETLARQLWADRDPIGQRVSYLTAEDQPVWREVVGVVADVRNAGLIDDVQIELYASYVQETHPEMTLIVRTTGDAAAMTDAVRRQVREVDPRQPVFGITTMARLMAESISRQRFSMLVLGTFAGVALLLAALGIYGVVSYTVAQQVREIGVRRALGAQERDVIRLVLRQGAAVTALGVAAGVAGALVVTRLLARLLFGVTPTDPLTFVGVSALLAAVALGATYLPARRAARVSPMVALRSE
ncbi:MAG: ABC transporter permease [Gemmatimonadaceae bacterium]